MARIDAIDLADPCSGSCLMVGCLARDGIPISRDRTRYLTCRMGFRAMDLKPRTTVSGAPSERVPCLVDFSMVTAVDQVWATDINSIPLPRGCLSLVVNVDLFSRTMLRWKFSNDLGTSNLNKAHIRIMLAVH